MTTTERHIQDGVQRFLASMRGNLDATERDLLPVLARLAADDEPVTLARLAAATAWEADEVRAALATFSQLGYDEHGRITGLFTRSSAWSVAFTVDGTTLYGCASDTLVLPVILGRAGVAESTCPATGEPIRVEVTPTEVVSVDPPQAVVSKVRPTEGVTDLLTEVCGLGHFYSSPEAAAGWLAEHPEGFVDTVADDFDIHRRAAIELGWSAAAHGKPSPAG
ncbi:hypothetical protein GIY23_03330 [Allosaccharopolyspora coralli]|uniref:Alkylmercury lyase n=1 Tax=Allosaccharopolyspora coralli TaxID=2665642 RepID=A0A5Q3Q2C1_9PSEU|nr:organomercurial lyase [Allosaccharopolyspora coralli]QGK68711.1 hypothetical protein GIY23_03330 [Allosaccharopolyspora coralli]